ncbi:MAG: nitrogenase stabilizing/protective protein NifW [Roseiarcus sp.]
MSRAIDELKALYCAEDFFRALEVPYDPNVLGVARLHILKRMGQHIAALAPDGQSDDEVRRACREALKSAYQEFTAKAPIDSRLFKVLSDRDPNRPARPKRAFVPLSDLVGDGA